MSGNEDKKDNKEVAGIGATSQIGKTKIVSKMLTLRNKKW